MLSRPLKRIDRSVKAVSVNDLRLARESVAAQRSIGARLARVVLPRWREASRSSPARSRGIGRAIARGARARRRAVVVGYRSGAEEAEALAPETGGRAVQADVADPEQAARLVEEAGDLDILVNNAGLTRDGLLVRMSDEDWRDGDRHEPRRHLPHCRAAARGMMQKRAGSIVNITLVVGVHGNPGQTNYAASKAGIIGFTKSLARELGVARRARERDRARATSRPRSPTSCRRRCSRRSSPTRRSAGSASRRTSPGRYAFSAPTRPRS